jgi:hypothetical protein
MTKTPPALQVSIYGKEILLISDGDHWVIVDCAWGADPGAALLHPSPRWEQVMPTWLQARRSDVAAAIEEFGLIVRPEDRSEQPIFDGMGPKADGPINHGRIQEVGLFVQHLERD